MTMDANHVAQPYEPRERGDLPRAPVRRDWSRRQRRLFARTLLLVPALGLLLYDWSMRSDEMTLWQRPACARYLLTLALSGALWGSLVALATARRAWGARLVLLFGVAFAVGSQHYFFARYHAYLNPRAVLVGTSMLPSIGQQLWSDRASLPGSLAAPFALCVLLVVSGRLAAPLSQRRRRMSFDIAMAAFLGCTFGVPVNENDQATSPDVLYLASLGKLASARWDHDEALERAHPGRRTPSPIPPIAARRNISLLFLVTESVRATDACSLPASECRTMPFTNALLPERFGFDQMRALDSTTAASLAVLWSGRPPTASRETLHTAPLLWEYARAAGFDTAYWTSQNLFFANSGTWLEGVPLSRWTSATDLDPDAGYELGADDAKLVELVMRDWERLRSPFVGVVHLSNTHFPYVIDGANAPFQPQGQTFTATDVTGLHNRYKDAIFRQDALIAHLVRSIRAASGGDRVILAYVSDHGEQMRERGAIGHTWGVYDEELRVPFWIDVPKGVLSQAEETRLRSLAETPLTQLDILPTLLDLMGVWSAPEMSRFREAMPGESLLRGGTPDREVVLTNCSAIFACAFKNWGAMRGTRKLVSAQNRFRWECYDVEHDPEERRDLGVQACGDLRALAEGSGRGTPF